MATPAHSHTRGQNELAMKASVRELAEEVRDLKKILTGFLAAMGNKEEVEEKRWGGFYNTWVKTNEKWEATLYHVEIMRDVKWVKGKDDQEKEVMKEGLDWCDRIKKFITKVAADGTSTRNTVDRL